MTIITIGRDTENRIVINDPNPEPKVSSFHAEIKINDDGSLLLIDKSTNGTYVNGTKIQKGKEVPIYRGNNISFANIVNLDWNQVPDITQTKDLKETLTVGKDISNNIQLRYHEKLSRYHAEIKITNNGKMFIRDLSMNGTYVNGTKIPKYKDYPLKYGAKVNFANVEDLEWTQIPKKKISHWYYSIPIAVIVLLLIVWGGIKIFKNSDSGGCEGKECLYDKYENTVALVYHAYVYKVEIAGETVYFDNDFNVYTDLNKVENPIRITGTAFFVSKNGYLITNRHVATPWTENLHQQSQVKDRITTVLTSSPPDDLQGLVEMTTELVNMKVSGATVFIGIGLNNTYISINERDFIQCQTVKVAEKDAIDLAVIQTKNKQLPSQVKNIFDYRSIVPEKELNNGKEIFTIGYPFGFTLADTPKGLKVTSQNGQISQESDDFKIGFNAPSFHGASGSPLFDKTGKLVGVCYAGMNKSAGFNFAIIGKHVQNLMEGVEK